jgi:hypothetical protein
MPLIGGGKMKRQFSVYHGRVNAPLADRRRVGDVLTLAEAKAIAEADHAKQQTTE